MPLVSEDDACRRGRSVIGVAACRGWEGKMLFSKLLNRQQRLILRTTFVSHGPRNTAHLQISSSSSGKAKDPSEGNFDGNHVDQCKEQKRIMLPELM